MNFFNFNSLHIYNVKKRIVRCLQHWSKAINSDTDAYQKEMDSLKDTLYRNNYPVSITSPLGNLDRTTENNTRKLTTVYLPYVKGLAEKIQNICSPFDQDNIQEWLNTSEIPLPSQAPKRRQHDQELYIFHPMQLW